MTESKQESRICVRPMRFEDLEIVSSLSAELGYPASKADIVSRFNAISESNDNRLVVALYDDETIGWCHVYGVRLLESDGYAELGGIVVSEIRRKIGIGRLLITDAELWARSRGFLRLRAYSGVHREGAHEFYRSLGYNQSTPTMFQRVLPDPEK